MYRNAAKDRFRGLLFFFFKFEYAYIPIHNNVILLLLCTVLLRRRPTTDDDDDL